MQQPPDKKIVGFIGRHHVMTLATCLGPQPWCANLFYAYMEQENLFVFTSDSATRHAGEAIANPLASGSVVLESKVVGRLQGLQFSGIVRRAGKDEKQRAHRAYLKRFPYAAVAELELWIFEPFTFKYTDNTLGFGKKLHWEREFPAKLD